MSNTSENKTDVKIDRKQMIAYEKCYYDTRQHIYWYILKKINNKEMAEDFTADVYVKLASNLSILTERSESGVKAWLFTVARNMIFDYFRSLGRKGGQVDIGDEFFDIISPEGGEYLKEEMLNDDSNLVKAALEGLKPLEKEIMLLRFKEGMGFKEISEIVDKSEGAVKMLLYRCLEKLKIDLDGRVNFD